jgi:hypothetical protein
VIFFAFLSMGLHRYYDISYEFGRLVKVDLDIF